MISVYTGGCHILLKNLNSEAYESQKGQDHKERKHLSTFKLGDMVAIKFPAFMSVEQKKILKLMLKHT